MLELRPLTDSDIPQVERWLNKEHVKKWYEIPRLGVTIDDWISEIRQHSGDFKWIKYLIILCDEKPIGMCLYYKCEDSEGEDFGAMQQENSYGIDYLIGEEQYLGKGLGKKSIAMLVEKIFSLPNARTVTADVDIDNKASQNALLSCGFRRLDEKTARFVLHKSC